ncbi:Vacuolar basic amino acid transporter 5 [Spathaspora sp. JA1]|nr:Vacuolar basic amino acid transporter 5 [Spathaspora sp. JA1]
MSSIQPNSNVPEPSSSSVSSQQQDSKKYIEADAGDGTRAHEQYLTGYHLGLTLASCIISLFLSALDQTIVSTILTTVGERFDGFDKVGWLTSGFMLPMACLAPSYGKISIAFGRKWTLLVGVIIFETGSLICALSNSMAMLIGGRVIQGIGGGAIQAMVIVIMTECVPISKRSLVFASISIVYSTSSILGPLIGGGLTKVSWRWCFYINLPIGGIAIIVLLIGFKPPNPKGNLREKLAKIDYIGTILLTAGLVLLLLALTFGGIEYPWSSSQIIILFTMGGVTLIAFFIWNFKFSKNPIILSEFLRINPVLAASLSAMFNFAFFIANLTYLALYFQVIFNASSLQSGIYLLPMVISVCVSSFCNSMFINITKWIKPTMLLSGILSPIGTGLFLLLGKNASLGIRIGVLIICGISIGLQFQSSLLSAQLGVSKTIPGALILVTIFQNFLKSMAATVAVNISQLLFQTTGTKYITKLNNSLPSDSLDHQMLSNFTAKQLISNPRIITGLPESTRELILDQYMKAFKNVFYWGLALGSCCFLCSLFTTNKRIPKLRDIDTGPGDNQDETKVENESKNGSESSDSRDQQQKDIV